MKKLYISGPLWGETDEEILEAREAAVAAACLVLGEDVEVIDDKLEAVPEDAEPMWFLIESLKRLAEADIVCFDQHWKCSREKVIQHECAVRYDIQIIELKEEADMKYRCGFPEYEEDRPCDNPNEDLTCDECTFGVEDEE